MAVEFAIILPILLTLLVGVITIAIAFSQSLGVTNAVREGSRFGAIAPYPAASGSWKADVISRTRATQFDDPGITTRVCVDLYKQGTGLLVGGAGGCDGASTLGTPAPFTAPTGTPVGSCAVRVWAARSYTIDAFLVSFPGQVMVRQSTAVYERSPCGT